jgi:multisubunit Na+/H+ antiporter MnhE subunit
MNTIISVILLTLIWVILREEISVSVIVVGLAVGTGCVVFSSIFLPLPKTGAVNPFRFIVYIVYLIWRMYAACIPVIKIIFSGASFEIVEIKTKIEDKFLQTVLVNSITLVPGSIAIKLHEDTITVLCLKGEKSPEIEDIGEYLKGDFERILLK